MFQSQRSYRASGLWGVFICILSDASEKSKSFSGTGCVRGGGVGIKRGGYGFGTGSTAYFTSFTC